MKIIIVGGGESGHALADILSENYDVTIIEKDEEVAKELANKSTALVINGDATDISILEEAGIKEVDVLVVTTNDDKTNLMVCTIARSEKVKKIIALVNVPANEELFQKLDISRTVLVVGTNVNGILRLLHQHGTEKTITTLGVGEEQTVLIEYKIPEASPLIDLKPSIENAQILALYREHELIAITDETTLMPNDIIIIAVKESEREKVLNVLNNS